MIREATAMKVRQNLGELLNEVKYRHDTVVITKGGAPVAALVDINLFERIRLVEAEFDRLAADLAEVYAGADPNIAEAEITRAVQTARRKKK